MKNIPNLFFLVLLLSGCGPDPIKRASEDPWSTKHESIRTPNEMVKPIYTPMVVHGETVRERALSILEQAIESKNSRMRANAIESFRFADQIKLSKIIRMGLVDSNRGVRFAAAMMVGETKLCDYSILLEPMLDDESASVQAAALCSLYRCGQKVNLNPIATMLESDDPELRGNAAMILGEMGNPSAVGLIKHALQTPSPTISPIRRRVINLQIAEALVKLGELSELEVIRAAIFTSAEEAEITALACQIAGRIKDSEILSTLESIVATPNRYPDEIRLIAASAIASINPQRVPLEIVLGFTSSEIAILRVQSAITLGIEGSQVNLGPLALMLDDFDPFVQIAAAGAVLRIDNSDSIAIMH